MEHVIGAESGIPTLPGFGRLASAISLTLHLVAVVLIAAIAAHPRETRPAPASAPQQPRDEAIRHVVFVPRDDPLPSRGGGGGGNRQPGPIRRAEGAGSDRITLRTMKPVPTVGRSEEPKPELVAPIEALPRIVLDAVPLASGTVEQLGLPSGGVPSGTSLGPGTGGGVGTGVGTGIGSGRGPGLGPGSGGGTGGGVYRPGGGVTTPRVITEVKPKYTSQALLDRVQGTVVLELVVQADGSPASIRVVRPLDPKGLDEQAVLAASQWRFEPGRLNGRPVNVLVTLMLDFRIR